LEAQPELSFQIYTKEDYEVAISLSSSSNWKLSSHREIASMHLDPVPFGRFDEKGFPSLWPVKEPRLRPEPFFKIEELDRALLDRALSVCREVANTNFGVFCMSQSKEEHMWAYYANNHKGLSISFDTNHPFFIYHNLISEIEYSDSPIAISSNHGIMKIAGYKIEKEDILDGKLQTIPTKLFLQKRTSWEHEKECRLIGNLITAHNTNKSDENGIPIYLFSIPSESIKEIIFGYKASSQSISNAMQIINTSNLWTHLEIKKRVLQANGSITEETLR
jgi:hypothetical protein